MSKVFVIDISKCSGCYNCQLSCKDEYAGNDWSPYSKPQPDTGHFWMKVNEHVDGTIPKVRIHYVPRLCNHCRKAACIDVCPENAIYRREDGLVLIDPQECVGCGKCAEACPNGVIYKNDKLGIFQKCSGCAHLLDNGHTLPRCVDACPTDAIRFGEEEELADMIRGAEVLDPETGLRPRVYYRNMPGQFIAGTVYDPVEEEVIIGARCIAVTGSRVRETFTDDFGDFWFEDLPVGFFDLSITAEGYEPRYFKALSTEKCINLGDIALEKKA